MMKQRLSQVNKALLSLAVGVVILAGYFSTQTLHKPFIGHHDWNGVQYGNMARNHLRYGLLATRFAQIENAGQIDVRRGSVNTHHPAALPVLLSMSAKLLGSNEAAYRVVPTLFSLVMVAAVIYLGWNYTHPLVGIGAGGLAIGTPMFRYFGNMPVHEPIILSLALVVVILYACWREDKVSWRWLWVSVVAVCLIGWPGYYIAPILFIVDWLRYKRPDWKHFLPLFATQLLLFVFHLAHNWWVTGSPVSGGLLDILQMRLLTLSPAETESLPLARFFIHEAKWVWLYFTRVQTILTGGAIVLLLWWMRKRGLDHVTKESFICIVISLLVYGITHATIFRNAAFIHEYMLYYLIPGMALTSAWCIYAVAKHFKLSSSLILVCMALVGIAAFVERSTFVTALQETSMHLVGKQVGEEIASITTSDQSVFLYTQTNYSILYGKFTIYYADRNLANISAQGLTNLPSTSVLVVPKGYEPEGFAGDDYIEGTHLYYRRIQ